MFALAFALLLCFTTGTSQMKKENARLRSVNQALLKTLHALTEESVADRNHRNPKWPSRETHEKSVGGGWMDYSLVLPEIGASEPDYPFWTKDELKNAPANSFDCTNKADSKHLDKTPKYGCQIYHECLNGKTIASHVCDTESLFDVHEKTCIIWFAVECLFSGPGDDCVENCIMYAGDVGPGDWFYEHCKQICE